LPLHHIQPGVGGELTLVLDQGKAAGFGHHDNRRRLPDAGNTGQLRQLAR
jgi:hypothetical protein